MEEERKGFGHPEGCYCANCNGMGGYHRRYHLLRWLLMLLALVIVFSVGVKVGEFKQILRELRGDSYGYHDRMMFGRGMMDDQPRLYRIQSGTQMMPNVQYSVPGTMMTPVPTSTPNRK